MTTFKRLALVAFGVSCLTCTKNADAMYTHLSAGSTGCDPAQMALASDATPFVWKVSCQGKTFTCTSVKGAPAGPAICVAEP